MLSARKAAAPSVNCDYRLLVLGLLAVLTATSCDQTNTSSTPAGGPSKAGKPRVYAVNYPLMYFAQRIAGDYVDVHFPVPPDIDPAYWSPDGKTVARIQKAELILLNGAGYAGWTQRVSLPESKLVNTTKSVQRQYIRIKDAVTHQHGPDGKHSHEGIAFTTWLDPKIAVEQARVVKDALLKLVPERESNLKRNLAALERDLRGLDKRIESVVSSNPKRPLVASHPVYQYLAKRYGLKLRSVHWEPDEMPDNAEWKKFAVLISEHPAKAMLWEAKPTQETSAKLESMGITIVVFAPSGNRPPEGDFMSIMERNVNQLAAAFK